MPIDQRTMRPRPSTPSGPTFRILLQNNNVLTTQSGAPIRTEQS